MKSNNDLFLYILHAVQEKFQEHAVLKGGMVLRILGSPRETLDLDYVFVPFKSKKEIIDDLKELFDSLDQLKYEMTVNSKAIRITVNSGELKSQVEVSVSQNIKSDAISTSNLQKKTTSVSSRVIRIMSLDVALAHKLAAWNERRLGRDLYDIHYFFDIQEVIPDLDVLRQRLSLIQSRLPKLRKIKRMSIEQFKCELLDAMKEISQEGLERELKFILPENELHGLNYKLRDMINRLVKVL